MTRDESLQIVSMVLSHWPQGKEWGVDEISAYAQSIQRLDAEIATHTVTRAVQEIKYRPSVAEFLEYYYAERRRLKPVVEPLEEPKATPLPVWVKRWICARLLYDRFGKEKDIRRFPEQGDYGDLTQETMPDGAWEKEAQSMGDEDFYKFFAKAMRAR